MLSGFFNGLTADHPASSAGFKKTLSPRMKVFTVGLDQKPPLKDDLEKAEKAGLPPPGYSPAAAAGGAVPLPIGSEPPPTPLIMSKSRGYKGILLVMLTVFLIALFALTLSEITYNRQRDENFFRLRWAELKNRLGDYADYDYYFNRGPYAYAALKKQKELTESNFGGPLAFNQQQSRNDGPSTTTTTTTTTAEPVLAEVIDTSPSVGSRRPLGADLSASLLASSSSSSQQTSAEQLLIGANGVPEVTPADARLQFLRSILRRIKQHAENMGFDGMMQVSVIEVEPQSEDQNGRRLNGPSPAIQQIFPRLFSHLAQQQQQQKKQQQQQTRIEEPHMMNVKSDSFLDGFGEIHQPSFMQNNEIAEHNRGHLENNNNRNGEHEESPMEFEPTIQWSRVNNPFRPEAFFPRPSWHLMAAQQQQQQPQPQPQPFSPQFPPHSMQRPFEWGGNSVADDEFMTRRFGGPPSPSQPRVLPQEAQLQPQQPQLPPPMIQVFPQSAPLFFPPQPQPQLQPAPQPFVNFPAGQIMGVGAGAGPEFRPFKAVGPPPPSPTFEAEPQQSQPPQLSMESLAAGQEMGEMNGGRIGQFVKELIANRLQALNRLQQQQQQPNQMMFVPSENRIQIEPPTPIRQQQMVKTDESENNNKQKSMIVDSDDSSANLNAGWTHQPKLASGESEDGFESVRNFAKMMAAGVAEEAARRRAEALAGSIPSLFFARPRAVAAAPLTIDSSSAVSAAADSEEPSGHSGEQQEPRKPSAFMSVLSIDPPMIDIPTVRFPPANRDASSSKAVVDRVTADDDKSAPPPPAIGERASETSAEKTKDDNSAPPALPQMNDAETGHANGVFFQVDDPASTFSVGQTDQRPIVTV